MNGLITVYLFEPPSSGLGVGSYVVIYGVNNGEINSIFNGVIHGIIHDL